MQVEWWVILVLLAVLVLTFLLMRVPREPFVIFTSPSLQREYARQGIHHDPARGRLTRCAPPRPCEHVWYRSPYPQTNNSNSNLLGNNKGVTSRIMQLHNIRCPRFVCPNKMNMDRAYYDDLLREYNIPFPVVVKPVNGMMGVDVHLNVTTVDDIVAIARRLQSNDRPADMRSIIIEEQVRGENYRVLVSNGRVVDVLHRKLAEVTGDGSRTLRELIDARNARQRKHRLHPTHDVSWNSIAEQLGRTSTRHLDRTILSPGQRVVITNMANSHNGCNLYPVATSSIHPDNIQMFLAVNRILGLNLSGIDYITPDIAVSCHERGHGHVIEVNSRPGFDSHVETQARRSAAASPESSVESRFVDALFDKARHDTRGTTP